MTHFRFKVGFIGLAIGISWGVFSWKAQAVCPPVENCPCDDIAGSSFLIRSTIDNIDDHTVLLTADEIIRESEVQFIDVEVGEQFGGSLGASFPCDGEPWAFEIGDKVIALFEKDSVDRYPDCLEYRTCTSTNCGPSPTDDDEEALGEWDVCDGGCVSSTSEICDAHREEALLNGSVKLLPDEDQIFLRGTQSEDFISSDNIIDLLDWRGTCEDHFPAPPPLPCNDTVGNATMCSLNLSQPAGSLWQLLFSN
jgi:hypothetical protein